MAEILVIRLDEHAPGEGAWIVVDAAGPRLGTAERGPLKAAMRHAEQRRIVVLVPGTEVLMTQASLPVRGAAKMLQVVPFALEEQLAEDVDKLHFAIGKRFDDGSVTVAVTRRDTMERWLATLSDAGIQAATLVPDTAGIPSAETGASILVEGDRVYLKDEGGGVAAFPASEIGHYIQALGLTGTDDEQIVTIFIGADERERHERLLETLTESFPTAEVRVLPNGTFARLAVNAGNNPDPDLLQGSFAPRTNLERFWRPWRAAAILLGLFVGMILSSKAIENMLLARDEAKLDADILSVFETALPGGRPVNARLQLERELSALRGSGGVGGDQFFDTLGALGLALAATADAELEALNHQNRIMTIKLKAPNVESLDKIKRLVSENGLDAEISSAEPADAGVEGRMRVSPKETA